MSEENDNVEYATVRVLIERDPMTKIPKEVRAWEVPVLRSQYGDGKVEIVGEGTPASGEEIDPREEYMRMRQVYGIESDTKQSHVDLIYGRGEQGVEALEKAMNKAKGAKSVKAAVEGAQKVVDTRENPKAKPSPDVVEAREESHRDPLDSEFADQDNSSIVGAAAGGPGDVTGVQTGANTSAAAAAAGAAASAAVLAAQNAEGKKK